MSTATTWLAALVCVAALFGVLHIAERPILDDRQHRAARDLCASELGPGAHVLWTREGDLVCRPATRLAGAEQ